MKLILEALYRGQLHPEEIIVPTHPEYRPLSRQLGAMTEKWRKELPDDMFRELEKYSDLCVGVNSLHIEAAFVHGFKLGANMMIEVMNKREELVPNEAAGVSL